MNIKIEVEPAYIEEQSEPTNNHYFFTYRVRISNQSQGRIQLVSRHWIITDGFGKVEEIVGPGVVGQQPTLQPGETFEYASFCPLTTPTGTMQGSYIMADEKGAQLEIKIPLFILCEPTHFH